MTRRVHSRNVLDDGRVMTVYDDGSWAVIPPENYRPEGRGYVPPRGNDQASRMIESRDRLAVGGRQATRPIRQRLEIEELSSRAGARERVRRRVDTESDYLGVTSGGEVPLYPESEPTPPPPPPLATFNLNPRSVAAHRDAAERRASEELWRERFTIRRQLFREATVAPLRVQVPEPVQDIVDLNDRYHIIEIANMVEAMIPIWGEITATLDAATGESHLLTDWGTPLSDTERAIAGGSVVLSILPFAGSAARGAGRAAGVLGRAARTLRVSESALTRFLGRVSRLRGRGLLDIYERMMRGQPVSPRGLEAINEAVDATNELLGNRGGARARLSRPRPLPAEGPIDPGSNLGPRRQVSPTDPPAAPPRRRVGQSPAAGSPSSTALARRPAALRLMQQAVTGLSADQLAAAERILGTAFTRPQVQTLADIWRGIPGNRSRLREVEAMINRGRSTREIRHRARRLFGQSRRDFWLAVADNTEARQLIESMGARFRGRLGTAPKLPLRSPNGAVRWTTIDIDHIIELNSRPNLSLSFHNLRLSLARENRVLLNQLNRLDVFQREGQIFRAERARQRSLVTPAP